jgi:hypothetical protein
MTSLIEELGIPSKVSEGYVRFCCPVCHEFNTSVNPKTNLARCFKCQKNYNTIDLVMLVNRSNFIQSVKFLKQIHTRTEESVLTTSHPIERTPPAEPVPISDIFKSFRAERTPASEVQKPNHALLIKQLNERLLKLEQKVNYLSEKIKK